MDRINDTLLRELALHLVISEAEEEDRDTKGLPIRLFPDEHWVARFHEEFGALFATGIFRVHPVSSALPRARVEFDISRFGQRLGRPPLLEMQVLTSLPATARALRSVLASVRTDICSVRPYAAAYPAHIILRGMESLLAEQIQPLCAREAHDFLAEMRECLDREVTTRSGFEVILSLR
jgi:hypothetical protein